MADETFTVTDRYLNGTIRTRFEDFLAEATENQYVRKLLAYTGEPPAPADDTPFTILLAGNEEVMSEVGQLESNFATMALSAQGNVKSLFDLIETLRDDFLDAKQTLDVGTDEALTTAQLLDLVRDVWQPTPNLGL
ncbi:hypothetical protein O7632_18025 [Solwaraspora sp. WMMD406]|uniref:hypothetical protein n=1 Tax=Solwaraspora sp. WMMD406 TaxID=3016095 RepID=UPI002417BA07|nr:hypothetical protein [Solwaraspora sp. WMMD406]MDG4765984.1 hypothetical protein [Solwaraspora sp. WMMD406]